MSVRAIQQFVVHFQSFRNIDLWYQGAYLLCFQIYYQTGEGKQQQRVYAHPFAHTEQYLPNEQQRQGSAYDTQIIKPASTHAITSSFLSKAFLLRYYEQQVQINDICHFRIETDLSNEECQFILQVSLLFYDQQIKKIDPQQITLENKKAIKTKKYILRGAKLGIHQYVAVSFDAQYFSLANVAIHSLCLDYRFRLSSLQLSQFSRLSAAEKKKILQKNRKKQNRPESIFRTIAQQLKILDNPESLQIIQNLTVRNLKKVHQLLLKQYGVLYARVITQQHRQTYSQILVHPSQLGLFQEQSLQSRGGSFQQKMYKRYRSSNEQQVTDKILNQSNLISGELLKLWHHFIDLIKISPRFTIAHYQDLYMTQQQMFWSHLRKIDKIVTTDLCIAPSDDNRYTQYDKEMIGQRSKLSLEFKVFNEEWIKKKEVFPFFVQSVFQKNGGMLKKSQLKSANEGLHLIVLVHGFQGNSLDMKLIKNNISLHFPQASFLCASSNQQLTDNDIGDMGNRLASQIKNHIIQFFPPQTLQRISFIGHSLGGVIIRAALPRLMDFKDKFHTFITFSSPHLGYKVNTSSVIQAGIWVLQKFKSSHCLKQLTMADNANPRETCLYKISKFEGLHYFKNIFFFSSRQDSYAPFESARIEIHPDFMDAKDSLKQIHCEMVRNILSEVQEHQLHRIGVNFSIEQTNIDSIIGRTAHILFLQNSQLIQMFLHTHPQLFS